MLNARVIVIIWGTDPPYWGWASLPESRFSEVSSLNKVWCLDIQGKVAIEILSPNTTYAAYLVFKLAHGSNRLDSAYATIRFANERDHVPQEEAITAYFIPQENGESPYERKDG